MLSLSAGTQGLERPQPQNPLKALTPRTLGPCKVGKDKIGHGLFQVWLTVGAGSQGLMGMWLPTSSSLPHLLGFL